MNARTTLSALTVGALLLLTACSSPAVEPAGLTASPTPTPSPTSDPSPTPTDGIQVQSDPEAGIVFEDVPDLAGDEAEVYNWLAVYEKAYWETMKTNQASATVDSIASTGVKDWLKQVAATNAGIGARIGGTLHSRIENIAVDGDTATGTVCEDYRDVEFTADAGTFSPEDAGFGTPVRMKLTLIRLPDQRAWYIQDLQHEGSC